MTVYAILEDGRRIRLLYPVSKNRGNHVYPHVKRRLFKEAGWICSCCGWKQDHRRQNNGSNGDRHLTVDHIIPVSRGGTNDRNNLSVLCSDCNGKLADELPRIVGLEDDTRRVDAA